MTRDENLNKNAPRRRPVDPDQKAFTYYPLPRQTDNPNIDRTREGAIVYTTRSNQQGASGIFYPDASTMTGYGACR